MSTANTLSDQTQPIDSVMQYLVTRHSVDHQQQVVLKVTGKKDAVSKTFQQHAPEQFK